MQRVGWSSRFAQRLAAAGMAILAVACANEAARPTPPIVAGHPAVPREVNLITRDYAFVPDVLELVPGETVLLHVVNGGLEVHEAVIGDADVQEAWEIAEAATMGAPPGPTPVVSVPPEVSGIRLVVRSGERVDLTWTVPADAAASSTPWTVGCHIPGHLAKGMTIPVRWVDAAPVGPIETPHAQAPRARPGGTLSARGRPAARDDAQEVPG